jgi:hypothetical protein
VSKLLIKVISRLLYEVFEQFFRQVVGLLGWEVSQSQGFEDKHPYVERGSNTRFQYRSKQNPRLRARWDSNWPHSAYPGLKLWPGCRQFWLTLFMVYPSTSRQMQQYHLILGHDHLFLHRFQFINNVDIRFRSKKCDKKLLTLWSRSSSK